MDTTDEEHSPNNSRNLLFKARQDEQNHHIDVRKTEASTYPTPLPKKQRVALNQDKGHLNKPFPATQIA